MTPDSLADGVLLDCLRPVLAKEIGPADLERLVVVGTGLSRRRSLLYFVGLAGGPTTCRWVVKQPHAKIQQEDLASPLPASAQYQVLRRLHECLSHGDGTIRAPRPLAFLAELDAYVMEYVSGPTLTGLIKPGALLGAGSLLRGTSGAARMLHAVHSIEPPQVDSVDLPELDRRARTRGHQLLEAAGLPRRQRWFAPTDPSTAVSTGSRVLLHGDFAPENVIVSSSGLYCLDPDLNHRDWAEHDVVRFLLMLFDAPLFVAGGELRRVQNLRRRVAATFLDGYYGVDPWPGALRPLMLESLIARWATRNAGIVEREASLRAARTLLVRRHFMRLLDEVAVPDWPASYR